MTEIFNRVLEMPKRRMLRNNTPLAENILWYKLSKRQLNGHRFRRQYSIDRYVVDFYCPILKIAIEIDGYSHFNDEAMVYDQERREFIESLGIKVLRFTNREVYEDLEGVLASIAHILEETSHSK